MKRLSTTCLTVFVALVIGCDAKVQDLPKRIEVPCDGGTLIFELSDTNRDVAASFADTHGVTNSVVRSDFMVGAHRFDVKLDFQNGIGTSISFNYYDRNGNYHSCIFETASRRFRNGHLEMFNPTAVLDGKAVDIVTAWKELAAKDKRFTIRGK